MRDHGWTHSGGVAFRIPLLPFATLERDLAEVLADPLVRAAIELASPDLAAALDRGTGDLRGALGYVARMSGRCVPFGLFAGCTGGTVEGTPAYTFAGRDALRVREPVAPPSDGLLRPNDTAHVAAGRLRYVEREAGRFHAAAVEPDDVLLATVERARDGVRAEDLAAALARDLDVSVADATEYVAELVDAQVLVGDEPVAAGIDSSRPASALVLGDAVLREVHRAVEVLHPLARPTQADADLAAFKTAFAERYGDTEQPLLGVLDEETGIGFGAPPALAALGAPLLSGLRPVPSTDGLPWTPIDHHLVDLLSRALRDGAQQIDLRPEDLHPLRTPGVPPLPDALAVAATVAAPDAAAVSRGEFRLVVREISGPNGVRLLDRFADLDPAIDALVRDHVAAEERLRPHAVFAAVPHGVAPNDLRVAVVDGRVVLRHGDREVVPRLTADDPRTSPLALYRFLGAVQHDGTAGRLRWEWGAVQSAPFLPRVVTGRLVLARAQWWWFRADLRALANAASEAEAHAALGRLRAEWRVPRWVTLNEMPLDLDDPAAASLLARAVRRQGQLTVRECLPGPDDLCAEAPEGRFAHEFVLPLVRTRATPSTAPAPRAARPAFVPGTEWLGVRLRTGVATADTVLRDLVPGLVAGCDLWFYERAPDLRLRLHGDPATLLGRLPALAASGLVSDVWLDTYRPGRVPEHVLHADSVAALRLLGDDLAARWRAAFRGVDRLLDDAGLDDAAKQARVRAWRDRLATAHGETGARAIRWAGRLYRAERTRLATPDPFVDAVLDERSARVRGLADDVLDDLCGQHVNRLLRAAHDTQQLVLYDLLDRTYRSRVERGVSRPRDADR